MVRRFEYDIEYGIRRTVLEFILGLVIVLLIQVVKKIIGEELWLIC